MRGRRGDVGELAELHVDHVIIGVDDVLDGGESADTRHKETKNDEQHVKGNAPLATTEIVVRVPEMHRMDHHDHDPIPVKVTDVSSRDGRGARGI